MRTINLSIPAAATDDTPISSSRGTDLGTWGDLQDDLKDQLRGTSGAFVWTGGQFDKKRGPALKMPKAWRYQPD